MHTLSSEITILYQFHDQKAQVKAPKICNINFWIENDSPPLWHFSKKSSDSIPSLIDSLIDIAVYCLETEVTCRFVLQGVHFAQVTTKLFVRPGKTSFYKESILTLPSTSVLWVCL